MRPGKTIKKRHIVSCLLMLFALAWLTVSTPFVYSDALKKQAQERIALEDSEEETSLPTTTEEKSENGFSTLSEYLGHVHYSEHPFHFIIKYYKCHPSHLYFAFHPDLFSPPPEA